MKKNLNLNLDIMFTVYYEQMNETKSSAASS